MLESKLNLNFDLVEQARNHASKVADDTQRFIDRHTTVAVERTVCRLLGIDGVNAFDVPLPNVVVEHLTAKTHPYADNWTPTAEKLWNESHPACGGCTACAGKQ